MKKQVLIIGGGASGLVAAIAAARGGAKVTVLEKRAQVGKKILMTGNGRCNLTNTDQDLSHYRCPEPEFAAAALTAFGHFDAIRFFGGLGIFTKNRNGYLYPYSEQASAVVDALRLAAEHEKVKISCSAQICGMKKQGSRFLVETPGWTYEADSLILACGSRASAEGSEDGYRYAESFGHRICPVYPALVQLKAGKGWPGQLAGIRAEARVRLLVDGREAAKDTGEVQFASYGISGIPVFQVSRYASLALAAHQKVEAELAFLPLFSREQLRNFLTQRLQENGYKTVEAYLLGLLPQKLIPELVKRAGIAKGRLSGALTEEEREHLLDAITCFRVPVAGTNGFEQAQVCTGGVDVSQISPLTMESRLVPGLYVTGELLDVDGACGGYNLQWAWTSGYLAGRAAGQTGENCMA